MFWKKKTGTEQRGKVKCGFNLTISSHVYNTSPQNSLLETFLLTPHSKYTSILYKYRLQWAMLHSPPPLQQPTKPRSPMRFPLPLHRFDSGAVGGNKKILLCVRYAMKSVPHFKSSCYLEERIEGTKMTAWLTYSLVQSAAATLYSTVLG